MIRPILTHLRRSRVEAQRRIEKDVDLVSKSMLLDAEWYCAKYLEVRAGGHDPCWHYCTRGAAADYDPNRLFDAAWYRAQNPSAGPNVLTHFVQQGVHDRRSPSNDFDVGWYLDTYVDIAICGMNPLQHFLNHGEADGRDPNPNFSTSFYRETYMQTHPLDASPIDHYRRVGRALGHQTMPPGLLPQVQRRLALAQSFGIEIPELLKHIELMLIRPYFLCVAVDAGFGRRSQAEARFANQLYPDWDLCESVEDAVRRGSSLGHTPWFIVFFDSESKIGPSALYCFASEINRGVIPDIVTCDIELDDQNAPSAVERKSALHQQHFSQGFPLVCVRGSALEAVLDALPMPSAEVLLQRVAKAADKVSHVPRVLAYREIDDLRPIVVQSARVPKAAGAIRHAPEPAGRTAVVYLARGAGNDWRPRFDRFVRSYREFEAGTPHELIVVFKGFESEAVLRQARTAFDSVMHETLDIDDLSFDIGAYAEASTRIESDRICFLNTNSEIVSANWLLKLVSNLEQPGIGLVGATGSHEAHLGVDTRFPPFPNIHIRSNAFMMRLPDARAILNSLQIRSKHDAHMAEHGFNSITRQVADRGLAALVVGRNGRGYAPQWWAGSHTYRMGTQDNVLIHDNQTRFYEAMSSNQQILLRSSAWGVSDRKTPFLEATP